MSYPPTDEQQAAIDIAAGGGAAVIQALAGCGKTSTLRMIAEAAPTRRFQFVAFNKQIVSDVSGSFPSNVTASTAHSLAYRVVGAKYRTRLNSPRMRGDQIAKLLRLDPFVCETPSGFRRLAGGFLGGLVKRSIDIFCQTADPEPTTVHVPPVPGLDAPKTLPDGRKVNARGPNHVALTMYLEPALRRYWADVQQVAGALPFTHGHYLKMWELSGPKIVADTILFDEAQDASPVLISIVEQQESAQLVVVGDSYQSIYGWTGAVDALERFDPAAPRTWLTKSFRFGPEIAGEANRVLEMLGSEARLVGRGKPGAVGLQATPDAVLFRTNAGAVGNMLTRLGTGQRVAMAGGADDVVAFVKGAKELSEAGWSSHPDLQCFSSWGDVQDYVANDPNGSDLKTLVDLVDKYSVDEIMAGLSTLVDERRADVVVSTAHKSKGREWDVVQLGGDFPDPDVRDVSDEERRLLYVACTRARKALDVTAVKMLEMERMDAE